MQGHAVDSRKEQESDADGYAFDEFPLNIRGEQPSQDDCVHENVKIPVVIDDFVNLEGNVHQLIRIHLRLTVLVGYEVAFRFTSP